MQTLSAHMPDWRSFAPWIWASAVLSFLATVMMSLPADEGVRQVITTQEVATIGSIDPEI